MKKFLKRIWRSILVGLGVIKRSNKRMVRDMQKRGGGTKREHKPIVRKIATKCSGKPRSLGRALRRNGIAATVDKENVYFYRRGSNGQTIPMGAW